MRSTCLYTRSGRLKENSLKECADLRWMDLAGGTDLKEGVMELNRSLSKWDLVFRRIKGGSGTQ